MAPEAIICCILLGVKESCFSATGVLKAAHTEYPTDKIAIAIRVIFNAPPKK